MRIVCYLILITTLLYACHSSPDNSVRAIASHPAEQPVLDSFSLALGNNYDKYFREEMKKLHAVGAAVAIVKDSNILLLKGYGLANAQTRDSVNPNTVFRIGSLSKGFTGVLAGILVHKNQLHWNDKVVQWIPEFCLKDKQQSKRLELWHLLSHTTGLPYHAYTNLVEEGHDLQTIMEQYFPKSAICGKEGQFYAYQNAAFSVSGLMMQAATGETFGQLIRELIFQPAQMEHASSDYASMVAQTNKALPHLWTGSYWMNEPVSPAYYNVAEAGGVNASISDMAQWLKVLLGNRPDIIPFSALDTVFMPVVKTGNERKILGNWLDRDAASYAMGWRVLQQDTNTIIYHSGYVNGYRGEIALNRKKKIGICVLFNGQTDLCRNCVQHFFELDEQVFMKIKGKPRSGS